MEISSLSLSAEAKSSLALAGITKLNPPQHAAIEAGLLDGRNIVVASPTASGKTLIAELAFLKCILERRKKALYIVPLRALASEKYDDFKRYESLGVRTAISVGDLDSSDSWLGSYDLIIVTSEKLDSLLRHEPAWIHEIGLVIADEVHLLNDDSRGPTLEVVLTRLRELRPQVLALSATIANAEELASWLSAVLVRSDYRPVTLHQGVYDGTAVRFEDSTRDFDIDSDAPDIAITGETLRRGKQALVFASSRRNAESIAEKAAATVEKHLSTDEKGKLSALSEQILAVPSRATPQCERLAACVIRGVAFHHAGLASGQRKLVEDAFRANIIKAIAATPTLAAGLNLPAYRVLIRDLRRYHPAHGSIYIPVLEYHQMAGRAGRPRYDKEGEA
ncbi:MAG: DEAD/DEAH box helicase, partial [Candidatus Aenigmarchaeota archaeon]|nr:DEAD/DEAH box helicase [Candidatus Aenigmarchaeota archaeon]